jgi:hypothetical protein
MKPQHWWAVYDTEAESDFYPFLTRTDAEAEMNRWLANGLAESFQGEEWYDCPAEC